MARTRDTPGKKHPDAVVQKHPPAPVRVGTFATVADVALRWGRDPSDAEAALIDLRLGDVERMILRRIPDLAHQITLGRISKADVVQVEAEVVLRLMRNPQGFISETDGDYSYQIARELSTGVLTILDEEWAALGYRRARMSILVPEPIVEGFEDPLADLTVPRPVDILVEDESALLPNPANPIAVTRVDRQLWLYDPSSSKANAAGWVPAGSAAGVPDGVKQGQLLEWDAFSSQWVGGATANGDGYTLVWSAKTSQWVVSANRFGDLTDVTMSTLASGNIAMYDGANWVNVAGYSKADVDQKLANVVSGLARKPAVQDILNDPPAAPKVGQNYIVGKAPTGVWAGHVNEVTFWDGSNWVFEVPAKGDTHTNLATNQAMTWNATDWVSLGSQAANLKDLADVKVGIPVAGDALIYDGALWAAARVPNPDLTLDDLIDVEVAGAFDGSVLALDEPSGTWVPMDINSAIDESLVDAKTYADEADSQVQDFLERKIENLDDDLKVAISAAVTGLSHEVAVLGFLNDAPPNPAEDSVYIVGTAAVGDFTGRVNEIATYTNGGWTFQLPNPRETHLNEADNTLWTWTGAQWISVGTVSFPQPMEDLILAAPTAVPADDDVVPFADATDQTLKAVTVADLGDRLGVDAGDAQTLQDAQDYADNADYQLRDALEVKLEDLQNLVSDTEADLRTSIDAAVTGLSHDVAVLGFVKDAPAGAPDDAVYIVDAAPTGAFAGHANQVAVKTSGVWVFSVPATTETHLNEADGLLYTWNGTAWVKITTATTYVSGVLHRTATALKLWVGSQAEFDAVTTLGRDATTLYVIV